jgi:ribose/xylose/arabinose/galactoside ABC-type transport system permease subunit
MPLVATLATRELFRGLAMTLSGDAPVTRFPPQLEAWWRAAPLGVLQPLVVPAGPLEAWWRAALLSVTLPLVVLAVLLAVTYLAVHHTWVGRMVYAIGDNEEAARFAGVPVRGIKLGLYAWCGLVAGACGAALVMRYGAAKADAERSLDLVAIACVVLGGIRVTGGAGHVAGTVLGIVTVATLVAGMNSIASAWRDTVTGSVLVAVAILNEAASRWAARRATVGR